MLTKAWILEATNTLFERGSPTFTTSDPKSCQFWLGPEQGKVLQQVQATRQASLLLGLYNPHEGVPGRVCASCWRRMATPTSLSRWLSGDRRTVVKAQPPSGQNTEQFTWMIVLPGQRRGQGMNLCWSVWSDPWFCWMVRDLEVT